MIEKLIKYLTHPNSFILKLRLDHLYKNVNQYSDEEFIKAKYKLIFKKEIDLDNPKTFNEKLNWLKLYDRKPLYTTLVDKFAVRDYVKDCIGEQYLVPLYCSYDYPSQINIDELPQQFVLKCNNTSGFGIFICKDKNHIDKEKMIKVMEKGFNENHYIFGKEWPYKNVVKKIFAEKYLIDSKTGELPDYKLFFFNGKFEYLSVCTDRFTNLCIDWFDNNLKHMPFSNGPSNRKKEIILPEKEIFEMASLGEKLVKNIPQCRVDFYLVDGNIYFGEMTFYESSGFAPFKPKEWDYILGSKIKIDLENKITD